MKKQKTSTQELLILVRSLEDSARHLALTAPDRSSEEVASIAGMLWNGLKEVDEAVTTGIEDTPRTL
jgi:hypothetical protein